MLLVCEFLVPEYNFFLAPEKNFIWQQRVMPVKST